MYRVRNNNLPGLKGKWRRYYRYYTSIVQSERIMFTILFPPPSDVLSPCWGASGGWKWLGIYSSGDTGRLNSSNISRRQPRNSKTLSDMQLPAIPQEMTRRATPKFRVRLQECVRRDGKHLDGVIVKTIALFDRTIQVWIVSTYNMYLRHLPFKPRRVF